MKCEWVKENIVLYIYNELPDDARYELEQHIARCAALRAELKSAQSFHAVLSELPVEDPSPNLLAASRMRLAGGARNHSARADSGTAWCSIPRRGFVKYALLPRSQLRSSWSDLPAALAPRIKTVSNRQNQCIAGRSRSQRNLRLRESAPVSQEPGSNQITHQVRDGFHAAGARFAERSAHPAIAAVCGAQQLQLGRAHGFGRSSDPAAERHERARSTDVCLAL